MTVLPLQKTSTTYYFDMLIDEKVGTITSPTAVFGKDWNAVIGHGKVETDVRALCYTNNPELSSVVISSNTYALGDYDFKDYSFTFNADDFIADKHLSANANGKYDVRLCLNNQSGYWLLFDDVSMYAVRDITATIDNSCLHGGTVTAPDFVNDGEDATFEAKPFYGNTFLGWYDISGILASDSATFVTDKYDNLTAKFGIYNQITDGSFIACAIGDTTPAAMTNLAEYHHTNLPAFEVVENTDTPEIFGTKVLKYNSLSNAAGSASGQLDVLIPVTVKKNTKYIFKFYYKNTDSDNVGFTILSDNTNWEGHAVIDYSAYYGIYGSKSSNMWSYGHATGKLKDSNAAIRNHRATFSDTDWNEMYVLFDSLENEGTVYATISLIMALQT